MRDATTINRLVPITNAWDDLVVLLLLFSIKFLFISCSQHEKRIPAESNVKKLAAPKITLLSTLPEKDRPKQILLNTVSPPIVTSLAKRNNGIKPAPENNTENSSAIAAEGRGFFTTYTTDNGLSLDQVYCSFRDKWGNLWFGTNGGGISKYDGKNFTTYTTAHGLANNVVWCITQDHQGNMWFGTDGSGASKYDGESFTNYTTEHGLADNVVFSITEDKNNTLWFGTLKAGVSKWDGKNFTSYSTKHGLANNAVKAIFQDSKGNIWFATLGGGVSKWDGEQFSSYSRKEGLASDKVWSIAEDNSGKLWLGTDGKGLSSFDGKSFTTYNLFNESSNDAIHCIAKDEHGVLWFASQKSGLIKYNGAFTKYSTANGLANNQIKSITEDIKGNLWLGSFGSGICKFAGNSFTNFTTSQGLSDNVIFSITGDKDKKLWMATSGGGVCQYDGKRFVSFTKADGLVRNEIYSVAKDSKDNLWFGTSGSGVIKFDGKKFTNYTTAQGLANNIVFGIAEDKTGRLWFATSGGGVSRFDGESFTNYTTSQGLAGDVVFSIKEDSGGNLWFGTLGGGVSKFDGKSFTNYTVDQGLADNVVWKIAEDKQNNLWFGTQHGLTVMQENLLPNAAEKTNQHFTTFSSDDGLPDNFITQVVQGEDETLYIGTNHGVCELVPDISSTKKWKTGRTFNTRHGYPVKDVNAGLNGMFKDDKGILWIATGSDKTGLVRFDPRALSNNKTSAPQVFINQIKLNNEAVSWRSLHGAAADSAAIAAEEIITYGKRLSMADKDSLRVKFNDVRFSNISKWQSLPQNLVLPYYFNNVSFEFGAIETGKNFLVNYKYFLEGYDKGWSPASSNTYVNFGNIYEGDYVFKVKAQSPEGVWSEPVSYQFTVLPPWWRTWWMYTLYAIVVIASVILFFWWKHRRMLYKQKILEHKVAVATTQWKEEAETVRLQKKQIEQHLQELEETQAQLIQKEKMASLGELTAGIAHEIQNPLNFVNNFSEVSSEMIGEMNNELVKGDIREAKAIASGLRENLEKINHHGKRAEAIVRNMLQHSRKSSGQKEPVDINSLANEYLRLSYQGLRAKDKTFDARMVTQFDNTIGKINVHPQELGRVLLNLFNNAFYAVTQKRKMAGHEYQPTVSVATKQIIENIEIRIRDNGNGIPEKLVDKIFQPFFTTKPTGQGTGLGLSLSYDIVTKSHGGEMTVQTQEGEFAEFKIILPAGSNEVHSN